MRFNTTFCIYFLLSLNTCAFAQEEPRKPTLPTLTIGVQDFRSYAPYSFYTNEEYSGFNRELFDAYAKSQSRSVTYTAMPIKRLYLHFLRGDVEFKYPDNPKWSAKIKEGHDIFYSQPVVSFIDGVAVIKQNMNKPKSALSRLGIIAGYTPRPYLDDIKKGKIRVVEVKTMASLVKLLASNRVDGIYTNITVLNSHLESNPQNAEAISFDSSLPYLKDSRHLSSKNNAYIIQDFNRFLLENKSLINQLKTKHNLLDADDLLNRNSSQPVF